MSGDSDQKPLIFVVSGPGGVGKGTVVDELLLVVPDLWLSRSWTTRDRRPGEAADAYHFATREEFVAHVEVGGFLEWVEFLDYLQGTPVPNPPAGQAVLLEIDVQGAAQIRTIDANAHLIFVDAPSVAEQQRRLRARGDSEERVAMRLEKAIIERAAAAELGCTTVINDELDRCVGELAEIIEAARENRT